MRTYRTRLCVYTIPVFVSECVRSCMCVCVRALAFRSTRSRDPRTHALLYIMITACLVHSSACAFFCVNSVVLLLATWYPRYSSDGCGGGMDALFSHTLERPRNKLNIVHMWRWWRMVVVDGLYANTNQHKHRPTTSRICAHGCELFTFSHNLLLSSASAHTHAHTHSHTRCCMRMFAGRVRQMRRPLNSHGRVGGGGGGGVCVRDLWRKVQPFVTHVYFVFALAGGIWVAVICCKQCFAFRCAMS